MLYPLLHVTVKAKGKDFHEDSFTKPELTVGRVVERDIVLPAEEVSRSHARIRWRVGHLTIMDDNSTNGTYVNGARISGTIVVPCQELTVHIWSYALMFKISSGDTKRAPGSGIQTPPDADEPTTAPHLMPTEANVRCLLTHMFPVAADLRAFLVDRFLDVAKRCPDSMDLKEVHNFLLLQHGASEVMDRLSSYRRDSFLVATKKCSADRRA